MRLLVATPTTTIVDAPDVSSVRAEDATGAFGIQARHVDFLTVLTVSVLSFRDAEGVERYVAVRGGVLAVRDGGSVVEVATREALAGDDLASLERAVLAKYHAAADAEAAARTRATQLHLLAIRGIYRYARGDVEHDGPPLLGSFGEGASR